MNKPGVKKAQTGVAMKGSIHTAKRSLSTSLNTSTKNKTKSKLTTKRQQKSSLLKTTKRKMGVFRGTPADNAKITTDPLDQRLVDLGIFNESQDPTYQFSKQYNSWEGVKFVPNSNTGNVYTSQFKPHTRQHYLDHFDEIPDPDLSEGEKPWDIPESKLREPHPYENIKPFIVERTKRRLHDPIESSAPGERAHTKHYEKFRNDAKYNIFKEMSGYNHWYNTESVLTPQNGVVRDFYTKTYLRDTKTGEATIPARYQSAVRYKELQKILQKADHYFFEDRPSPIAQLLVPLKDPRTVIPDSPLSSMVTNLEKKHNVGLPYGLDPEHRARIEKATKEVELPRLKNEDDLMTYMQGQVDKLYDDVKTGEKEYLGYINSVDQRQPNMSLIAGQHWTAQMRRAEFWRKYIELFTFCDLLHTTTVRCTRAIGRVDSAAALVIMGNGHGIFTYGRGKASVHEQAVRMALLKTRRNVLFTPLHENRAPYYAITGKFKASTIVLRPQQRGVGLRAGRLTFTLLQTLGYKDASAKLRGRPNIWNIVRAWMECLKYQESYREIANMRGQHYQQMMNPWTKAPPIPSREEIQELEDVAAQAFKEAVIDIFKSRQLFETDTFKDLVPHFTERANWIEKWDRYLDMANVPKSVRLYPGFSEYLDATKLLQEKKFREEIHSDLDDIWSPTETDEVRESPDHGMNNDGTTLFTPGGRENPQRYRTARDDQPYYQYYKDIEQPKFNRKAMRFSAMNNHIQNLATSSMTAAVGGDMKVDLASRFPFPTDIARAAKRQAAYETVSH